MKTKCWKCKTEYEYNEDASGTTHVKCPKCGTEGIIKTDKHKSNRTESIFKPSILLIISLGIILICSIYLITTLQSSNDSLQTSLSETENDLEYTQNILAMTNDDLNITKDSLIFYQGQIITLQNNLEVITSSVNIIQSQLESASNELNITTSSLFNTSSFINSYCKANGLFYNGTYYDSIGTTKYNSSEVLYNNASWSVSSENFNRTIENYSKSKEKFQNALVLCQDAKTHSDNDTYDMLCDRWVVLIESGVKKVGHMYDASQHYVLACKYNIEGNATAVASQYANATTDFNLYKAEQLKYDDYFDELKEYLMEI